MVLRTNISDSSVQIFYRGHLLGFIIYNIITIIITIVCHVRVSFILLVLIFLLSIFFLYIYSRSMSIKLRAY